MSLNLRASDIFDYMEDRADELNLIRIEHHGARLIDAGVKARGGFEAGRLVSEICMGGLATVSFGIMEIGDLTLPSITVRCDDPPLALLASQYAGWRIKTDDYFAMGSGPARALALKPRELYEKLGYREEAGVAVLVLEADGYPSESAIRYVARECGVEPGDLRLIVASTSSVVGSIQISARVLETGLHKLNELGMDVNRILCGIGKAPIAPVHPKPIKAMGRTNDMILYAGMTHYVVDYDEEELVRLGEMAPSSSSKDYGRPFYEIFKDYGFDFYKVDPMLFAPAVVSFQNLRSGRSHRFGRPDPEAIKASLRS